MHSLRTHLARIAARLAGLAFRMTDPSGGALVELGVMLPLVGLPLLLGTACSGILLVDSIEVSDAARAGANYAMVSSTYAQDTVHIQSAAQQDSPRLGSAITVTPTIFYVCSTAIVGTQYTTQTAANTACTGSSHPLEFVQVLTSASVTPPVGFGRIPRTITLSGSAIAEVEE